MIKFWNLCIFFLMIVWRYMNKFDIIYFVFWDFYDEGRFLDYFEVNKIMVFLIYVYFVFDFL